MRATVIVSEFLVYIPAVVLFVRRYARLNGIPAWSTSIALVAILMQPATILIDHGHFQYNTVMLGLMVASISTFAAEISKENVLKKRVDSQRVRTLERSTQKPAGYELSGTGLVSHPMPLMNSSRPLDDRRRSSTISRRAAKLRHASATNETSLAFETPEKPQNSADGIKSSPYPQTKDEKSRPILRTIQRTGTFLLSQAPGAFPRRRTRKPRALLLREEKDRFLAMRSIESSIKRWKGWTALVFSVTAFLILWCCGSAVFLVTERDTIGLSYFDAMYFCYVSLLTM